MATPSAVIKGLFRKQYSPITYPIVKPKTQLVPVSKGVYSTNVKKR